MSHLILQFHLAWYSQQLISEELNYWNYHGSRLPYHNDHIGSCLDFFFPSLGFRCSGKKFWNQVTNFFVFLQLVIFIIIPNYAIRILALAKLFSVLLTLTHLQYHPKVNICFLIYSIITYSTSIIADYYKHR